MESSSTIVHIVGENLLRAIYKLFCSRFCVSMISENTLCEKDFTLHRISGRCLYENDRNNNSCKSSYKFASIPFLPFHRNKKQISNLQQVGVLVTRNCFAFCLLNSGITNSIDFHKSILLHVILACIIVPCRQLANIYYLHQIRILNFYTIAFLKTAFSFYKIRYFVIRKSLSEMMPPASFPYAPVIVVEIYFLLRI